jgi:methylated-DNA-[protein]-cysteine S-methyltransferase
VDLIARPPSRTIPVLSRAVVASPVGRLVLVSRGVALWAIELAPDRAPLEEPHTPIAERAARELERYFEDPDWRFTVAAEHRGTVFQRRVWRALAAIRRGETRRYGDLAGELGVNAQAVGQACRANPVPIVVPCHRVVAAGGLGGYGGAITGKPLAIKRWLLRHEGVTLGF